MVNRCVAAGCGNVATATISVFAFPIDEHLRRKWVAAVRQNRRGWACDGPSAHFTADCIEISGVARILVWGASVSTAVGCSHVTV